MDEQRLQALWDEMNSRLPTGVGQGGAFQMSFPDYSHLLNADELQTLRDYNAQVLPANQKYNDTFDTRQQVLRERADRTQQNNESLAGIRGPGVMAALNGTQDRLMNRGGSVMDPTDTQRFIAQAPPPEVFDPSKLQQPKTAAEEYANMTIGGSGNTSRPSASGSTQKPKNGFYYVSSASGADQKYGGTGTVESDDSLRQLAANGVTSGTITAAMRSNIQQLYANPVAPTKATIVTKSGSKQMQFNSPTEAALAQAAVQAAENWTKVGGKYVNTDLMAAFNPKTGKFEMLPQYYTLGFQGGKATAQTEQLKTEKLAKLYSEFYNMLSAPNRTNFYGNNYQTFAGLLQREDPLTHLQYRPDDTKSFFEQSTARALRLLTMGAAEQDAGVSFGSGWVDKLKQLGIK